jgi:hypothetical protein
VAVAGGTGYGQHRDLGLRPAGIERLQQTLRIDLLSPAAAVQQRRRLRCRQTTSRQRSQRRWLGATPAAGDRAATEAGQGSLVTGRCRLCEAGHLRSTRRAWGEVRNSDSGERLPAA